MKTYVCHKTVKAGKIEAIEPDTLSGPGDVCIWVNGVTKAIDLPGAWVNKHKPEIGGYLVEDEDGYKSYSPAKPFEGGHHALASIYPGIEEFPPDNDALSRAAIINIVSKHLHRVAKSKGWHDGELNRDLFISNQVANIHGEVSELWEAFRAGKLDEECDKNIGLTCLEEELADIIIRACDTAWRLGVNIGYAVVRKSAYNETRPHRHGGKKA